MPSTAAPKILAMITCDAAHRDTLSGKWSLLGIFNTIGLSKFPSTVPPLILYLAITEIQGEYPLVVQMLDVGADRKPVFSSSGKLTSPDPSGVFETAFAVNGLTFSKPGEFSLQVLANNELIGIQKIRVKQVS